MGEMIGFDSAVLLEALSRVLDPFNILIVFLGVAGGIIIGIIPGMGATMAIAILIPFTFTMLPETGMALLVAVYIGSVSGGCLTAILIRLPGTPASVATLLDGFPMATQGKAGQAISNAVVASFFGTIISGIILIFSAPLLAAFALKFHFAEYVAVCVFALTAISAVSGSSMAKGLLTGMLGVLLATFGISEEDGVPRFNFGSDMFLGGFTFLPALMGLFAVSQIMVEVANMKSAKKVKAISIESILPSLTSIRQNLGNYLRSGLIGTVIGVIPAVGGATAGLISYAQAKNASKEGEKFGTGHIPGIVASETANNAAIGGALIIMLTLGIPGDPATAVLIGGLMIHGLEPGPRLFMSYPEVLYAIYLTVFLGAFFMMFVLLAFMRPLAKVMELPKEILLPLLFVLAATGVYSTNNRVFDILVMCGFGCLGYILERMRYPLAPLVLGFVLGPLIEGNFRKMLGQYGDVWPLFTQPIALMFMVLTLGSILWTIRTRWKAANASAQEPSP
ncbi:putative tricarboxylic transport membrane protein [Aliiruegeria haliotis]|uniref:Putative tricarboxylic transport membrane protein n=1 Tax=Aliiruegeria haliotis TaxID=1280846 RepID=A0A2T0RFK9_9RHOB|nr:tripartite tricarboxylate transporter permease [Aliiruegeria haliotis]PRY19953.1 putative tricarboxylic transport membrane protein [Aliiruegeria haliotis]